MVTPVREYTLFPHLMTPVCSNCAKFKSVFQLCSGAVHPASIGIQWPWISCPSTSDRVKIEWFSARLCPGQAMLMLFESGSQHGRADTMDQQTHAQSRPVQTCMAQPLRPLMYDPLRASWWQQQSEMLLYEVTWWIKNDTVSSINICQGYHCMK